MFRNVTIEGFRGLRSLHLDSLRRINLLVGTNNSGKTSVLEALYLLARVGDPNALFQLMQRRGERLPDDSEVRNSAIEFDVCHLFTGHEIGSASNFRISASNSFPRRDLEFSMVEVEDDEVSLFQGKDAITRTRLLLNVEGSPSPAFSGIPLSSRGGIAPDTVQGIRRAQRPPSTDLLQCMYISADSLSADGLIRLWDRLALTDNEEFVLHALRYLDPNIERIAALASNRSYSSSTTRGSFILKMRNLDQPIPIGSMGDGMWRMLAMAIAITQSRGGLLLVDEIDTGLHHTVMSGMWEMLMNASRLFDVQIFATTHSFDCVNSLARTRYTDQTGAEDFTVQRIESGNSKAVPYSPREVAIAADRGIEVR